MAALQLTMQTAVQGFGFRQLMKNLIVGKKLIAGRTGMQ